MPPKPTHPPGELPASAAIEARAQDRPARAWRSRLPSLPPLPARPAALRDLSFPGRARIAQALARGVVSALIAVGIGLAGVTAFVLIVAVVGAADGGLDHPDVLLRAVGGIWLAAHHIGFEVVEVAHTATGSIEPIVTIVPFRLAPLGVTVPLGWMLWRLGRRLAQGVASTAIVLVTQASVYLGLLYAVARGIGTVTVRPVFETILVAAAGVLAVATLGALGPTLLRWPAVRAGLAATAVVAAGGAILVVVCLLTHTGRLRSALAATGDDAAGRTALILLCAALVPNTIVWAASYAAGTGFVLGTTTTVAPTGTTLGTLPALPLLAALPGPAAVPSTAWAPLALPVLAGLCAGFLAARTLPPRAWPRAAAHAAGAGGTVGLVALVAARLASGAAGLDNLATLGPDEWRTAAAIAAEITVIAVPTALGTTWWRGRSRRGDLGRNRAQAAPAEAGTACAPADAIGS
jgi:hypothetical protein